MTRLKPTIIALTLAYAAQVMGAGADTGLSCQDIEDKLGREPTGEALQRFQDLRGSCEGVVEINGNLYMKTRAVVRQPGNRKIRIYLPATDHTFSISPDPGTRINLDGRKVRPSDLNRGQEFNIYVSVDEFTQPVIDELAFLNDEAELDEFIAELIAALPTTG